MSLFNATHRWLVTGAAGFIGSNLVEELLQTGQKVTGLDNFSTGKAENIERIKTSVGEKSFKNFNFIEGDIRNAELCRSVCKDTDYVLHQAALGSVPRSIKNPLETNEVNVGGFLNMITAAHSSGVKKFVYASSSSVYGDSPDLPKVEDKIGKPLSPYAASKLFNEIYASVFTGLYDFDVVGLRYFNVFGPRQDPDGQYAAVIPRWIKAITSGESCTIFGDGSTSRDFCYIKNVVSANFLAAVSSREKTGKNCILNVANHASTSLNELFHEIKNAVEKRKAISYEKDPVYQDFRPGDVKHSLADISKARALIGYEPLADVRSGIKETVNWFC